MAIPARPTAKAMVIAHSCSHMALPPFEQQPHNALLSVWFLAHANGGIHKPVQRSPSRPGSTRTFEGARGQVLARCNRHYLHDMAMTLRLGCSLTARTLRLSAACDLRATAVPFGTGYTGLGALVRTGCLRGTAKAVRLIHGSETRRFEWHHRVRGAATIASTSVRVLA